jgi:ribosome maturation factor RimP
MAAPTGSADIGRTIADAVAGLQYELIDVERGPRGLLRVTIDRLPGHVYAGLDDGTGASVTVQDCERVTRQLQYALEVEGADYARLEVSSPGLDRPLRNEADYRRFAGHEINLALKLPFEGRKHWRGTLGASGEQWSLLLADVGKATRQELMFRLDEVREARLVPVIDFKGRKARSTNPSPAATEPMTPVSEGGKPE